MKAKTKYKVYIMIIAVAIIVMAGIVIFLNAKGINKDINSTSTADLNDTTVVAVVDGEEVTYKDLDSYTNIMLKAYGVLEEDNQNSMGTFRMNCLKMYTTEIAVEHLAKKNNIVVSDEDFKTESDTVVAMYGGEEEFKKYLDSIGADEDFFNRTFKVQLLEEKIGKLVGTVTPTDKDLEEFFNQYKDYYAFDSADLSIITCDSEEKANECKSKFDAGSSFADLFAEYDTTDSEDGKVGVIAKDEMIEEAQEVIWATEVGKLSAPVKVDDTSWILFMPEAFDTAEGKTWKEFESELVEDYQLMSEDKYYQQYLQDNKVDEMIEYKVDESDLA